MKNQILILLMLLMTSCTGGTDVSRAAVTVGGETTPEQAAQPLPSQTPTRTEAETDEEKAVRLAEEFIKRNGYTGAPADKEQLTLESIEWESDTDRMLAARKNTLEATAYGVSPGGKGTGKGWTVVFRHQFSQVDKKQNLKTGRAVTMDENFENLKMQHVEFFLNKVQRIVNSE
jgi:hypothetical protein